MTEPDMLLLEIQRDVRLLSAFLYFLVPGVLLILFRKPVADRCYGYARLVAPRLPLPDARESLRAEMGVALLGVLLIIQYVLALFAFSAPIWLLKFWAPKACP